MAYAIGVPEPVSILVNTFGTGKADEEKIAEGLGKLFDFRPAKMITQLNLKRPVYKRTAAYGHFGREEEGFTWELTDRVDKAKEYFGLKG